MNSIGERLKLLRQKAALTQQQVADVIGKSKGNVSGYESGSFEPSASTVIKLSECFNISTDYILSGTHGALSAGESELLKMAQPLSEFEKIKLAGAIPIIVAFQRNPTSPAQQPPLIFPTSSEFEVSIYDVPSSAGTGLYLDSEDYTVMTFPADEVPKETSFGVRLRGDSMMPDFKDGDIVFLKRQPGLLPGEIGIFMLDGNAYCKKYIRNEDGAVFLKSLNPQYDPIPINECSDLRVLGKVIGKIHGNF